MLKCIWHCSRLLAKVASVKALTCCPTGEPAHARESRSEFHSPLAQSQPSVKVVQITDRDRARNREAVRDKEERLVVKTDTVYIEKRDSSLRLSSLGAYGLQEDPSARSGRATISGKLSAVSKILKWICWIIIGLIGLIVTAKICHRR